MANAFSFTPRDITIQEDGTAEEFTTAYVRTGAEGGRARWVPEGDTTLADTSISMNGTYSPAPNYGYDAVEVHVAGGVDPDNGTRLVTRPSTTAGSVIMGRDPETGALVRVALREVDGQTVLDFQEVEEEDAPSGIIVLIQPAKTRYKDGQPISYSGMSCVLVDSRGDRFTNDDYPTGDIPWAPARLVQRPEYDTLVTPIANASYEGEAGGGEYYQVLPVQWTSPYDEQTYEAKAYIVVEEVQS